MQQGNCLLCNQRAQIIPPQGSYFHIQCPDCGEYKVSFPAMAQFKNAIERGFGYIMRGDIFHHSLKNHDVFIFTTTYLNDIEPKTKKMFRLFKVSSYVYHETTKKGLMSNVDLPSLAAGYAKNTEDLYGILEPLKKYGIISFESESTVNGRMQKTTIFLNIVMEPSAFLKFKQGINSLEEFQKIFIDYEEKRMGYIKIGDNSQVNMAIGSNSTNQSIQKEISENHIIQELLKDGVDISDIDKIREEIKNLTTLLNKNDAEKKNFLSIFSRIKNAGGLVLLKSFLFLSKNPEAFAAIKELLV